MCSRCLGLVLAIGIVVDDAIVVVEAVQVNIASGMKAKEATLDAMRKVTAPVIATTLVLIAVFIPVAGMVGITGLLLSAVCHHHSCIGDCFINQRAYTESRFVFNPS